MELSAGSLRSDCQTLVEAAKVWFCGAGEPREARQRERDLSLLGPDGRKLGRAFGPRDKQPLRSVPALVSLSSSPPRPLALSPTNNPSTTSSLHPHHTTSMPADIVPRISLRDFDARREDIKAEMMEAATNSGFLCATPAELLPRPHM